MLSFTSNEVNGMWTPPPLHHVEGNLSAPNIKAPGMESGVKPWRAKSRSRAAARRRDDNAPGTHRGSEIPSQVDSLGTETRGALPRVASTPSRAGEDAQSANLPAGMESGARSAFDAGDPAIDERLHIHNGEYLQPLIPESVNLYHISASFSPFFAQIND